MPNHYIVCGTEKSYPISWPEKKFTHLFVRINLNQINVNGTDSQAVVQTEAFKKLKEIYETNKVIYLWDFDGYDYLALNMTLKQVLNLESRKMGHAFVLAMLLKGELWWEEENKAIDTNNNNNKNNNTNSEKKIVDGKSEK
jgi:hypothetical protein